MNKIEQSALKARTPRARTHRARAQTQRRTPCSGPPTRLAAASSRAQFKAMSAFKPDEELKGMQLLGFTPAEKLPQTLFLKSADFVLPVPRKTHPSGMWASGGTDAENAARCAARGSGAAVLLLCGACSRARARALALPRAQLCGGAVRAGDGAGGQRVRRARTLHPARACPPACRAVPCPCSHPFRSRNICVRFSACAEQKGSDVRLGALSPVLSERGNYLVLNALPFGAPLSVSRLLLSCAHAT